ncbi:MAG: hypothetical protein MMC23_006457 [Stictis urceolatum]|nr:hypothetical protein [Stictis urceolata]
MAFKGLISLPFTQGARSYRLAGSGEKYEGLRDSISETGSEEQLLSGNSEEYARRREDIVIRFKRSFLVYTGLALIVLILVAVIATVTQRVRGTPKDARFPTYPMPDFPTEPVRFMAQDAYAMGSMPESDQLWEAMIPRHNGVIEIESPKDYGLGNGHPGSTNNSMVYIPTWAHSLHCLKMIRMEFWSLINQESDLVGSDPRGDNLSWQAQFVIRHINHCFDYHRQQILCASETTLEAEAPRERESDPHHINGMGSWHMCRNHQSVLDWMDEHIPKDAKFMLPEFHRPPPSYKSYVEHGGH